MVAIELVGELGDAVTFPVSLCNLLNFVVCKLLLLLLLTNLGEDTIGML